MRGKPHFEIGRDRAFIQSFMATSLPVREKGSLGVEALTAAADLGALRHGRLEVLDGVRGIAILLVMMFHFWETGVIAKPVLWEKIYSDIAGMGWIGVDLFFVLSGFLITGILYDSRKTSSYFRVFYGRRIVRIFPLYYAALIFFFLVIPVLLPHIHHSASFDIGTTLIGKVTAWTYLLNWYEGFKGFDVIPHPLQHFWSLAIEEQFYMVWPFLVLKLSRRRLISVCFGIMAVGLALRMGLYWIHLPIAAYTWTFCRADSLAVGAVVALCLRDPEDWRTITTWARRLALPGFCGIVLLRVLSPSSYRGPGADPTFLMSTVELSLAGIFFASCLTVVMNMEHDHLSCRLLGSRFLRFFGKYSYCLYVCHVPMISVFAKAGLNSDFLFKRLHNEFLAVVAMNVIGFSISIAIALLSWNLYEKQWLKLKDHPLLRRADQPMLRRADQPRQQVNHNIPNAGSAVLAESAD